MNQILSGPASTPYFILTSSLHIKLGLLLDLNAPYPILDTGSAVKTLFSTPDSGQWSDNVIAVWKRSCSFSCGRTSSGSYPSVFSQKSRPTASAHMSVEFLW